MGYNKFVPRKPPREGETEMEDILQVYIENTRTCEGGWLTLPADEEEIRSFLRSEVKIGEECCYTISGWESDYWDRIDDFENIYALNEEAQRIDDMNDYEQKTMRAAVEVFGDEAHQMDIDELVLYEGVHTDYDLGYYWAVESGCYSLDDREPLVRYFDYEAFGRDIDLESNGGYSSYGYVEYR